MWQPGDMGVSGEMWFTGPRADRTKYSISDPTPLPGGQGYVFRARATTDSGETTDVSLKLLDVDADGEQLLRDRWSTLAENPHDRVAGTLEVFTGPGLFQGEAPPDDESDVVFGATRWIDGQPLRALAPLPPHQVAQLAIDLADAADHLHSVCGFVHRDLHPGNVIIDADGRATVIDLGAARPDDGTATTTVAGMLGFIAPERTHATGDASTDSWGVGMLVAFAALGHPIGGTSRPEWEAELRRSMPSTVDVDRLAGLIERMTAPVPGDRPSDIRRWADDVAEALTSASRRRWRPVLMGAMGALAVTIGLAGAWAVAGTDGGDTADSQESATTTVAMATTTTGLDVASATAVVCSGDQIGVPGDDASADASALVIAASAELAAVAGDACATAPADILLDAVFQPIHRDGEDLVVVVSPAGSVTVTRAEWQAYTEISGRERPENAIERGGYISAVEPILGGEGTKLILDHSGIVIGRRRDTQSFWMPRQVLEVWEQRGGITSDLGFPVTNPYEATEGLRQEFEGGHISLPIEVLLVPFDQVPTEDLRVVVAERPGASLEGVDIEERILRQSIGTSWFIEGGTRRWIADGGVWECRGGWDSVAIDEIYGPELASIPLGPPARCPD